MGALHGGHLALVERARSATGAVVCSIFVNPLQFNDPQDLARYPRRPVEDRALLEAAGCDVLFAPLKEDLFQDFVPREHDLGGLDRYWEGPARPGHFQGVVNVVERLFFHVRPDRAFFGEKDRQQLAIIRHVAKTGHWPEEIVPCPTVRAEDGLALSSRNQRLTDAQRTSATVLHKALRMVARMAFRSDIRDIHEAVARMFTDVPGVVLEQFGVAHPDTLEPMDDWGKEDEVVALIAARVGQVRLIDNVTLVR